MSRLDAAEAIDELAKVIHYPECWDTDAFPTVAHAALEVCAANFTCGNEECKQGRQFAPPVYYECTGWAILPI